MRVWELFNAVEELDPELVYDAHAKRHIKLYELRRAAIAASVVLLAAAAALIYGLFVAPSAYIYLDCRESASIVLNARGRVLSASAAGEELAELSGRTAEEAVRGVTGYMLGADYISSDENTMILGCSGLGTENEDRLANAVGESFSDAGFSAGLVTVSCNDNVSPYDGISPSRAAVIDLLAESGGTFSVSGLRTLSANELNLLLHDTGLISDNIALSGEPSDTALIGYDKAVSRALSQTRLGEKEIDNISVSYSVYSGRLIYLVRVSSGDIGEAYFINASSGAVEQAVRAPANDIDDVVEREIKDPTPAEPYEPTVNDLPTSSPTAGDYNDVTEPDNNEPDSQPTIADDGGEYATLPLSMKELSFVLMSPPEGAEEIAFESLFEGQCFAERGAERSNDASAAVLTSYKQLSRFLDEHSCGYTDSNGSAFVNTLDEEYFDTHAVIAVEGAFADASYRVVITGISADDSGVYAEVSLSYGEPRSGEYLCRAMSLYSVDRTLLTGADVTLY